MRVGHYSRRGEAGRRGVERLRTVGGTATAELLAELLALNTGAEALSFVSCEFCLIKISRASYTTPKLRFFQRLTATRGLYVKLPDRSAPPNQVHPLTMSRRRPAQQAPLLRFLQRSAAQARLQVQSPDLSAARYLPPLQALGWACCAARNKRRPRRLQAGGYRPRRLQARCPRPRRLQVRCPRPRRPRACHPRSDPLQRRAVKYRPIDGKE